MQGHTEVVNLLKVKERGGYWGEGKREEVSKIETEVGQWK